MTTITPIKDPGESVVIEFDFTGELSAVGTAVVEIDTMDGAVDPSVASVKDGAHQIVGTKVLQRASLGVSGINYAWRCMGINGSDKVLRSAVMPVRRRPS